MKYSNTYSLRLSGTLEAQDGAWSSVLVLEDEEGVVLSSGSLINALLGAAGWRFRPSLARCAASASWKWRNHLQFKLNLEKEFSLT